MSISCVNIAMADSVSNQALKAWLQSHTQQDFSDCESGSNQQAQHFLVLNPSVDNPTFLAMQNNLLLICLYGLEAVNQSLCLGQPSGCQQVSLLVPTSAQLESASSGGPVGSSNLQKLDSVVY